MQTQTTTERPAVAVDSLSNLPDAVHPAWHQAIIRLANATERVAVRLEAFMGASAIDGRFDAAARELVESLIDYLDASDLFVQDEREEGADDVPCDGDELDGDESDNEPSLGWPERIAQGVSHGDSDDREAGIGPRRPQNRTEIAGPLVSVETSYRRFVRGLTPEQRKAMRQRQPKATGYGSFGDVVL